MQRIHNALDDFTVGYKDVTGRIAQALAEHGPHVAFSYDDTDVHKRLRQVAVTNAAGKALANFGYRYDRRGLISAFVESYLGKPLPDPESASTPGTIGTADQKPDNRFRPRTRPNPPREPPLNPAFFASLIALLLAAWCCRRTLRVRRVYTLALVPMLLSLWMVGSCSEPRLASVAGEAKSHSYRYDALGRLTAATVTGTSGSNASAANGDTHVTGQPAALSSTSYEFTYDAHANLTGIRTPDGSKTYAYTATNALESGRYDANGNPLELEGAQYSWDIRNRLTRIVRGDQAATLKTR